MGLPDIVKFHFIIKLSFVCLGLTGFLLAGLNYIWLEGLLDGLVEKLWYFFLVLSFIYAFVHWMKNRILSKKKNT
ncbi:MAG: hypothetical protein AB1556_07255 [Bacillota bacterium]